MLNYGKGIDLREVPVCIVNQDVAETNRLYKKGKLARRNTSYLIDSYFKQVPQRLPRNITKDFTCGTRWLMEIAAVVCDITFFKFVYTTYVEYQVSANTLRLAAFYNKYDIVAYLLSRDETLGSLDAITNTAKAKNYEMLRTLVAYQSLPKLIDVRNRRKIHKLMLATSANACFDILLERFAFAVAIPLNGIHIASVFHCTGVSDRLAKVLSNKTVYPAGTSCVACLCLSNRPDWVVSDIWKTISGIMVELLIKDVDLTKVASKQALVALFLSKRGGAFSGSMFGD